MGSPLGSPRARAGQALEAGASRFCAGLIALGLLAGLAYSIQLGDRLRYPDERDFLRIAENVAQSGAYSRDGGATPTAYRAPGYPLVLAGLSWLGAPIAVLRMLGFAALSGAAWFVGRAVERTRGGAARVLVTAAIVFYPLHFYTASTLYPQTLAMLGIAILLDRLSATRARRELSVRSAAVVAAVATGLILTVPPMLPAIAVIAVGLALAAERGRSRLLLLGLALVIGIGSWTLRNASALGHPIPFSTNSGYNLALGNSPRTLASSGLSVDISEWRQAAQGKPEVERDRYFRDAALAWIEAEPTAAARLYVRKFAYFFAASNRLATSAEQGAGRDLLMYLSYGPAALLAAIALVLAAARRRPLSWLEASALLAMLATAAFYAIFFTRLRFRVPVEPAVLIVASGFLAERLFGLPAREPSAAEPGAVEP